MSEPPTPPAASDPEAVAPSRLVSALERLDGQSRDLLEVSMRRRTPDDVLARLLRTDRLEVSRRRAAAIRRLSEACEVRDVGGVGTIMHALLDPDTWSRFDGGSVQGHARGEAASARLSHLRSARV